MSKIKVLLADDYTIPYDTLEPSTVDEPSEDTWAIVELEKSLAVLENSYALQHLDILKESSKRLQKIIQTIEQPF